MKTAQPEVSASRALKEGCMNTFRGKPGKIAGIFPVLLLLIFVLQWACSPGQKIDGRKFTGLNIAALAAKNAIDEGKPHTKISERVQQLSDEIAAAKDKISTKEERALLKAYSDLLGFYRDGLQLWRYQLNFPFLSAELKGRIYVGQDVEPIVRKYRLATTEHIYRPTGQHWKSIDEDSIRIIWRNADDQLKIIADLSNADPAALK